MDLTSEQQEVLDGILKWVKTKNSPVAILTGGAGTGKTTLLRSVVDELQTQKISYGLLAPTGRASRILGQKTGRSARTIHAEIYMLGDIVVQENPDSKQLSFDAPEFMIPFVLKKTDPGAGIFIVDEASMVSDIFTQSEVLSFGTGRLLYDLLDYSRVINQQNNNSKISLFTPAGESRRFGAYLIDNVLITYGGIIIGGIIAGADSSNTILTWIGVIIIIFFWFIYELIKDGLYNGQSIGKLLAGVKVVDYSDETKPCSLIQSVKRNLTIFIPFSAIIYYLEIREHYDKRRMGDGWANTIVIMPNEKLDPKKGVQQLKSSKGAKLVKSRNISNMCDKCGKITTTNLWDLEDGSVMCNKCFTGKE